eukprot:jgi/Mesen1/7324/ME000376S06484
MLENPTPSSSFLQAACQKFKPHYEKVARLFNGPDAPYPGIVYVAKVDCAEEVKLADFQASEQFMNIGLLCKRFAVAHYPTLLWSVPAVIARGSLNSKVKESGIESIAGAYQASTLLEALNERLGRVFDLEAQAEPKAAIATTGGSDGLAGDGQELARKVELHDIEEATTLAFDFIFSSVVLGPESRGALSSFVLLLASHHPSRRCREGSASLLVRLDDLWPPEGGNIDSAALGSVKKACKGSRPSFRGYRADVESMTSRKEAALWIWRAHNQVNGRLAKEEELDPQKGDPHFRKVQWPNERLCRTCHLAGSNSWNDDAVFTFLVDYFEHPHESEPAGLSEKAAVSDAVGVMEKQRSEEAMAESSAAAVPAGAAVLIALSSCGFAGAALWWRRQQKRRKLNRRRYSPLGI